MARNSNWCDFGKDSTPMLCYRWEVRAQITLLNLFTFTRAVKRSAHDLVKLQVIVYNCKYLVVFISFDTVKSCTMKYWYVIKNTQTNKRVRLLQPKSLDIVMPLDVAFRIVFFVMVWSLYPLARHYPTALCTLHR